ncbi:MAG TPA: amino acid permease [Longimicrobiales bacterium]|nr:amino acid permease [Longimicrobiales bacterium]
MSTRRSLGLVGATAVGVGSIIGGSILALAGESFVVGGPSAMLAFTLNGGIAALTALAYAELATRFPESGGTYAYARKALTIEAAFVVGWIFWFALITSAVLYAVGFAEFVAIAAGELWRNAAGSSPGWLQDRAVVVAAALVPAAYCAATFTRRPEGGGVWINAGKVLVYAVLIAAGLAAIVRTPEIDVGARLTPFMAGGWTGVLHVMGLTFIALHGFDLVAAVGGDVADPQRTIPRAMMLALAIALAIYVPLLFVVAVAGIAPGETLAEVSRADPEALVAHAAQQFMGPFGYWLVIVAALLSLFSALQANLFAATRVAYAMARDRTLPHWMERLDETHGTPVRAIVTTTAVVAAVIVALPDVAAAGAAASLIFLVSFALTHWISVLARGRGAPPAGAYRMPLFPATPIVGGLACVALATFEGIAVPSAGAITAVWLTFGGALFLSLFSRRARVYDAASQALDPQLVTLRGHSPLVLVPIANPGHADAMVQVATALAPPQIGRVLLLDVVPAPGGWDAERTPLALANAQDVLKEALTASFQSGLAPEALTTIAADPWDEIARIASTHGCESMLLGLGRSANGDGMGGLPLDRLIAATACDVVVLRARPGWRLEHVRRVVVPLGGKGDHDVLRARLLGTLHRIGAPKVTLLRVLDEGAGEEAVAQARRELFRVAVDESPGESEVQVVRGSGFVGALLEHVGPDDLVVVGLQRVTRHRTAFGPVAQELAARTSFPLIMISRRL